MKILDIPQSGKRGLNVSQAGRFGQISRTLAIPANPRTRSQMTVRDNLSQDRGELARSPGGPTGRLGGRSQGSQEHHASGPERESQRVPVVHQDQLHAGPVRSGAGGGAAGASPVPRPGAAESGHHQHGWRGRAQADLPNRPRARPLSCWGSAPVSAGRETYGDFRVLGICPAPVQGSADITSLYTSRYGVPPSGKKVFVQVNQVVDGWEEVPVTFSAIVPTAP